MPTRTFAVADATSVSFIVGADGTVLDGVNPPGTAVGLDTLILETDIGSWEGTFNFNSSSASLGDLANVQIASFSDEALIQEWTIDFDRLSNPIPDSAQIKKLTFRRPRTVNLQFNGDPNNTASADFLLYSDGLGTPIYFTQETENPVTNPFVVNESITGVAADEILFDLTSGPLFITKAELISLWSDFNNNLFGISIFCQAQDTLNPNTASIAGSIVFGDGWVVTVEYEEAFNWTLDPPEVDGNVVTVGPETELEVTSTGPTAIDFTEVLTLEYQPLDIDGNPVGVAIPIPQIYWITNQTNLFRFRIPPGMPTTTYYAQINITSTQFSGSVTLAQLLAIYFYNAPGIYQLVPGQRFDTYYNRPDEGVGEEATFSTRIPRPFARTGYV